MNLALAKRLALLPLVPLLMAATTLVDPPPLRAPPELTSKEIVKTLQGTLVERGWLLGEQQGDAVDATLHVRSHALTVRHPELKCALIAFSGCGALVAPQPEQDAELGDEDAGVE